MGLKTVGSNSHKSLLRRLKILPGQHGHKRTRKMSDFGTQLREKQKVKRIYGLLERQFRKYFEMASLHKGNTGEALVILLERRLDNVIYRLNFAPTRASARQFISHQHILVDGKKVNIPSFLVEKDMVITLKSKIMANPVVKNLLEDKNPIVAKWLARKGPAGKVLAMPNRSDVLEDINEQFIIEFYSR